jgi:hypothetical protein
VESGQKREKIRKKTAAENRGPRVYHDGIKHDKGVGEANNALRRIRTQLDAGLPHVRLADIN